MAPIVFRHLPAIAEVERQLELQYRDRLLDDEIEELPHLVDEASLQLFGITSQDTFSQALPDAVRARYGRSEWEANFDTLGQYTRDPTRTGAPSASTSAARRATRSTASKCSGAS